LTLTAGLNYIEPADGWVQVLPGDVLAYDATTALLSSRNATVPGFDPDFHCTIAGNSILKFTFNTCTLLADSTATESLNWWE